MRPHHARAPDAAPRSKGSRALDHRLPRAAAAPPLPRRLSARALVPSGFLARGGRCIHAARSADPLPPGSTHICIPVRYTSQNTDFTVDIAVKYIYRGYTAVTRHLPKVALLFVAASLGVSNSGGL